MPYRSTTTDEVLLVEWGEATASDIDELLSLLRKSPRRKICIAILRNTSGIPRAPARHRMAKTLPELLRLSTSIHYVQKDVSVRTAQLITFAMQLTTARVFLNNSVRQALEMAKPVEGVEACLARFRKAGFDVD